MSLSRPSDDMNLSGKVIVGMNTPGPDEMTLQEIEGKRQLIWDETTNEEYLARVKEKAKEAAKEIKLLAELEAEALRATARHEGYQEGLSQAQADIDAHIQAISANGEALLSQLGSQGATISDARKKDLVDLISLAVRKTLKVELDDKRRHSLEALMDEALERIESRRKIDIRCHPEDVESLQEYVSTIQDRNPDLKYWTVKGDPAIQSGGVVIEAEGGKVDNTIDTRWEGVEPIFDNLAERIAADTEE